MKHFWAHSQCGYIHMQKVVVPSYVSLSIYVHMWYISKLIYVHMWDIFKFSYIIICICMYICTISENERMVTCMPFPSVISCHGHVYSHMCSFQSPSYFWHGNIYGHMLCFWAWSYDSMYKYVYTRAMNNAKYQCMYVWDHVCCFHAVVGWMRIDSYA